MKVRICFHDQCFDGACSAALFTAFYRACVDAEAEFSYCGLAHRAGQLFEGDIFAGDENAIVDFKYSSSPLLTWWFDHHQSAFLSAGDAEHFRADRSGKKFYGPEFRSCTKFIAHVSESRFGYRPQDLNELVAWADVIDGAQYPDAQTAVEMRAPALQLALVIEGCRSKDFVAQLVPELVRRPLAEIAALPHIAQAFRELYAQHERAVDVLRERCQLEDGVVFFDLSQDNLEGYNKFIPYYLFPQAVYSVGISRSSERTKIAVGSNPWNPTPKNANLASICERYGGGGHAKVAAISLPPEARERSLEIAREIVRELRASFLESG